VKEAEDDDARDAEDEHESALADEPFADFALGSFEGLVEAMALRDGEEGEEEAVGVFALKHEVDAEEGGGEDVEEVGEPLGYGGEEVAGGGIEGAGGALSDGVEAQPVGEGDFFDFGDDVGDALGKLGREVAEIAQDRRKARGEEEGEDTGDGDDQENDGDDAGRTVAAKVNLGDAVDGRHEDDREESADVDDQDLLLECPGEGEQEQDADREENMAADRGAGPMLVRGEVFGQ